MESMKWKGSRADYDRLLNIYEECKRNKETLYLIQAQNRVIRICQTFMDNISMNLFVLALSVMIYLYCFSNIEEEKSMRNVMQHLLQIIRLSCLFFLENLLTNMIIIFIIIVIIMYFLIHIKPGKITKEQIEKTWLHVVTVFEFYEYLVRVKRDNISNINLRHVIYADLMLRLTYMKDIIECIKQDGSVPNINSEKLFNWENARNIQKLIKVYQSSERFCTRNLERTARISKLKEQFTANPGPERTQNSENYNIPSNIAGSSLGEKSNAQSGSKNTDTERSGIPLNNTNKNQGVGARGKSALNAPLPASRLPTSSRNSLNTRIPGVKTTTKPSLRAPMNSTQPLANKNLVTVISEEKSAIIEKKLENDTIISLNTNDSPNQHVKDLNTIKTDNYKADQGTASLNSNTLETGCTKHKTGKLVISNKPSASNSKNVKEVASESMKSRPNSISNLRAPTTFWRTLNRSPPHRAPADNKFPVRSLTTHALHKKSYLAVPRGESLQDIKPKQNTTACPKVAPLVRSKTYIKFPSFPSKGQQFSASTKSLNLRGNTDDPKTFTPQVTANASVNEANDKKINKRKTWEKPSGTPGIRFVGINRINTRNAKSFASKKKDEPGSVKNEE